MDFEQIEGKALRLSESDRAKLAQKLLLSLDASSESEIADDWIIEAQRRARELDTGAVRPISAEEVRRKARALLRCNIYFIRQPRRNIWTHTELQLKV